MAAFVLKGMPKVTSETLMSSWGIDYGVERYSWLGLLIGWVFHFSLNIHREAKHGR